MTRKVYGPRAAAFSGWLLAVFIVSCAPGGTAPSVTAPTGSGAVPSQTPASSLAAGPTRLVIAGLAVDLPVIAGVMDADGNPTFPPCDVAAFLPYYAQPGSAGTTYLYAHARPGMLLTLLEASRVDDGSALIGERVDVYTSDGRRYTYETFVIKRHALDYSLADELTAGEQRLIVQTSEGLVDDPEKVQLGARLIASEPATLSEARTSAAPRDCSPGT